jgi:hypothetical protein
VGVHRKPEGGRSADCAERGQHVDGLDHPAAESAGLERQAQAMKPARDKRLGHHRVVRVARIDRLDSLDGRRQAPWERSAGVGRHR